jgi:hypothetical protein
MKTKDNLIELAKITKKNAESKLIKMLLKEILKTSPILDKFSTLLLIGVGATASLMIANLEKILPIIGQVNFKDSIYLLVVSILFGVLAKIKFFYCQIALAINENLENQMVTILEEHDNNKEEIKNLDKDNNLKIDIDIDIVSVIQEFNKAFPRFTHRQLFQEFKKGTEDQFSHDRKSANNVYLQGVYVTFQLLTFIFFMLFAVHNL